MTTFATVDTVQGAPITVKIIADSITDGGSRVTTAEWSYWRAIHCFDAETEVLTFQNECPVFVPWPKIYPNTPLAAYDRVTGLVWEEVPVETQRYEVDTTLVTVRKRDLSFAVTKNHRLFVGHRKRDRYDWGFTTADELLGEHTQKKFVKAGARSVTPTLDPSWLKLVGFFIGDGTYPGNKEGKVGFHLKKGRKISFLHTLLSTLGIPFDFVPYEDGTTNTKFTPDPYLAEVLRDCYTIDTQKQVPQCLQREVGDRASFGAFLEGLLESDGSINSSSGVRNVVNTSSRFVVDSLLAMAPVCSHVINDALPYEGIYKLSVSDEVLTDLRRDKHRAEEVAYRGEVFCATVSTGALIVRRDGTVHVSGNSEIMTHGALRRNAASSRAIPAAKLRQRVVDLPFIPGHWGQNQAGMQAFKEVEDQQAAQDWWLRGRDLMAAHHAEGEALGLHKQILNRVIEPWMMITIIVTATDWANFFHLRRHADAEPNFQRLANLMWDAYLDNTPTYVPPGGWHLPYVREDDPEACLQLFKENPTPGITEDHGTLDLLKKVSTGRCARVSYLTHAGVRDVREDVGLHDKLLGSFETGGPGHFSPFEHPCEALGTRHRIGPFQGFKQYRKFFPYEAGPDTSERCERCGLWGKLHTRTCPAQPARE